MIEMEVHHVWFPTHGRMLRRIRKRGTQNKVFHGQLFSINPFRAGLVYETRNDESRPHHLGGGGVALNPGRADSTSDISETNDRASMGAPLELEGVTPPDVSER